MQEKHSSFFWVRVFVGHLIAFTILAMCIALPLGGVGFWSGYVGWALVLTFFIGELDDETKDALKRWALKRNAKAEDIPEEGA